MPQHVRMGLEAEFCLSPDALDHAGESSRAERRTPLGRKYEWRLRFLFALEPP